MIKKGAWIAASAFGFLASLAPQAMADQAAKDKDGGVICDGINSCKGKGSCAGADHACGGKNACKGQGHTMVKTKEECLAKKGTVVEPKKEEPKKGDAMKPTK